MKISNVNYKIKNNRSILSADIVLKNGNTHSIYFEIDKRYGDFVLKDASPFLATALGICMKNKEDLVIDGAVSKKVITKLPEIMKILESWNLGLMPVSVKTKHFSENIQDTKNIGCFFSGGVDSFYTYLKNKDKINCLIFVHGFDINVKKTELFQKIKKNIVNIARQDKIDIIIVKTNIREVLDRYFEWDLSHGFGVSSVSLFLGSGFKEIYASCGLPNKNMDHHSMTPELDPLWSSENMKFVHYGCEADKIAKLKLLSEFPVAMENLRVCWVNKNLEYNCCECEKCLRNMLGLYASDSLESCITFNKKMNMNKLKKIKVSEYCLKYFEAILDALVIKGDNSQVRVSLEEFIFSNKYPSLKERIIQDTREAIRVFDKKYNKNRLYWFLVQRNLI